MIISVSIDLVALTPEGCDFSNTTYSGGFDKLNHRGRLSLSKAPAAQAAVTEKRGG